MTGKISQLSDVIIISVAIRTLFVHYCMYVSPVGVQASQSQP